MSKFNKNVQDLKQIKTLNLAGGLGYKVSDEMDLYMKSCATMLSDGYYKSANNQLKEIQYLVENVDPEFTSRLAIYAREKMHLRTLPIVLSVELAKNKKAIELGLVRKTIYRVIQRPDEINEILSYYIVSNNRKDTKKLGKISSQIKKGLSDAFNKFNEYGFSKYNRKTEVKFKDVLCLVHPKPKNEEQSKLFKKILEDNLEVPYTWEVELSKAGQEKKNKKSVWEELIESDKMGYMALLRNIRNFIDNDISNSHLHIVGEKIKDENSVRNSKQLPFRFFSAYRAINDISSAYGYSNNTMKKEYISNCLEKALKVSIENLELFKSNENILIASDVSGSMFSKVSDKSEVSLFDIGILMAMMLKYKCNFVTSGMFGNFFKVFNVDDENILKNVDKMLKRGGEVGYSTNGASVIDFALKAKTLYDRICIFTDTQMYNCGNGEISEKWKQLKKKNPNCKLYIFNLASYGGSTPVKINENDVYLITGWSDSVFKMLQAFEDGSGVLKEIKEIEI